MILVEAIYSGGMLERFAREAALVQRLEHPNTVRLFDYGTTEQGLPYIVFELLRGRTLEQELERGTLTPFRVGRVASQVLKSLMEAHALGIVHRDIKPSNVLLVDYSGETDFVKVLDFGVARNVKVEGEKPGITHDGQIIGTPSYMAPEQVRGGAVGPEADLYALGLVMAEATIGSRIYGEGSAMEIWMKQTSSEPVPLPHLVTSSALGPVIVRATRKLASERYPSAEEMLGDVERALLACGAPTDPFAKPLVQELSRITARLTHGGRGMAGPATPPPPLTPFAMSPGTGPSPYAPPPVYAPPPYAPALHAASSPASAPIESRPSFPVSSQGAPSTGTSAAIVILGIVAILSLLVATGAGYALYKSKREAAAAASTSSSPTFTPPTHAALTLVTPERTERRLRDAGWSIAPSSPMPVTLGFKGTFLTATRGAFGALVQFYEYDSESIAKETEAVLRKTPGPVVERDGGRILYVYVAQDPAQSRALFDELVR
jgi:serine/threonine protein kinase